MELIILIAIVVIAAIFIKSKKSQSSLITKNQTQPVPVLSGEAEDAYLTEKFKSSDRDDWVGMFWEVDRQRPTEATLHLNYQSGRGEQSARTVDVHSFGYYMDYIYFTGFCRKRQANRSFRTDRVLQCIDVQSGAAIDNIHSFLVEKYKSTPEYSIDILHDDEYDTLRILLYIGKADGFLMKPEKAIIRNTCRMLVKDSRITDTMIDKMFKNLEVPTVQAFKLAVNRISKRDIETCTVILKAAQDMVATQKTVHPLEKDTLAFMERRLIVNTGGE